MIWGRGTLLSAFLTFALLLTGCSLFKQGDNSLQANDESLAGSSWLISAQGKKPSKCDKSIAQADAKKQAEKSLAKNEVKALKKLLEGKGKKLNLNKVQGCKVKSKNNPAAQDVFASQTSGTDTTLVEISAGIDASLYLLENTDATDSNYWVSLKEVTVEGDRLVHYESGLSAASGAQIQSLAVDEIGQMSFVIPNATTTQEITASLQQILADGGGLQAMQTSDLNWASAQVVIDDSSAATLADGSVEMDALIAIPSLATEGQQLWGDPTEFPVPQAKYVKTTVTKKPATPTAPAKVIVTTPPTQVKQGSDLQFNSFDLCPYEYYGTVDAFNKPLCALWEQKAAPKVQAVTFDRGVKSLPAIQNQAMQTTNNANGGIIGMSGPNGNLLLVGMKQIDSQTIQKIYEQALGGTVTSSSTRVPYDNGEIVEGQQWQYPIATIIINFIKGLWDLWNRTQAAERSSILSAMQFIWSSPSSSECRNFYNSALNSSQSVAYTNFINGIAQALANSGLQSSLESAKKSALDSICAFINTIRDHAARQEPGYGAAFMLGLIDRFGAVGIFAYANLESSRQFLNSNYAFPSDLKKLFEEASALKDKVLNFDTLMQYLAAAAYQTVLHQGSGLEGQQGLEGIARSFLLLGLFTQLDANGWHDFRVLHKPASLSAPTFDFYAKKNEGLLGLVSTSVYGFLEPYLTLGEVEGIIQRLIVGAQTLRRILGGQTLSIHRYLIVQVIDNVDSEITLNTLCQSVRAQSFSTPIVVIVNGAVACQSNGISQQEAVAYCYAMGFVNCSGRPLPGGGLGPTPNSSTPPTTSVMPINSALPDYCIAFKICLY